eukprot:CAMPEP_0178956252 /NCGR_PEP_ID=MMETSP0789-20121207/10120_1 /TAXON_ID=3005 /ORGANISM="Rhizosolenia setigera, Strain CCMP 1694" /LENGTH=1159 /DNA_ID=CAMNT_0020638099 /DNA_START=71 /DNA_END=3550 /DNA_ORIENTATION=-
MSGESSDDDFDYESGIGAKKYPVHDCCEFEDHENLRRLIFVREDSSDDSSTSSSSSDEDDDDVSPPDKVAINNPYTKGKPQTQQEQDQNQADMSKEAKLSSDNTANNSDESKMKLQKNEPGSVKDSEPKNEDDVSSAMVVDEPTTVSQDEENKKSFIRANEVDDGETDNAETIEASASAVTPPLSDSQVPNTGETKKNTEENVSPKETSTNNESDEKNDINLSCDTIPSIAASFSIPSTDNQDKEPKKKKKKKEPREVKYYCPYDLDQRDEDENTPLHVAIHERKLECVKLLIEAGANVNRKCDGSAPVHLAISLGAIASHSEFAEKCLSLLTANGADLSLKDDSLHTPLYLACMSDVPRCAQIILADSLGATTLNMRADRIGGRALHACAKYCKPPPRGSSLGGRHRAGGVRHPTEQHSQDIDNNSSLITKLLLDTPGIEVDAMNVYGQTPLHVAAARGNWIVARLLLRAGANPQAQDRRKFTPGGLAAKRGIHIPNDLERYFEINNDDICDTDYSKRDLIMDPDSSTILLCHGLCNRHFTCPPIRRGTPSADPPPENVRRLHVLINEEVGILRSGEFQSCSWETQVRRAAMADVLRVHDYSYIERVSQFCASIPDHPSTVASLDPDTAVSRWSFEAALRAAGAVCDAVDKVMIGDHRNAFCAVRPPGHHAGPRGVVTCPNDTEGSHGFCLMNNVAIGAAYARSMYRNDGIRKVAIIDFDVHHGNGTEEIVRQLAPNVQSGAIRTDFAFGNLQMSRYTPWLDEDDIKDVFFASTHGFGPRDIRFQDMNGGWFYPASGKTHISDALRDPTSIEQLSLTDFLSTQTWTRMGEEARTNCCKIIDIGLQLPRPYDVPGMQRVDVRDSYRKGILPHLMEFDPDMIFISAGFDAHRKDGMNFGYVGMLEEDYEWVTEQLVKVANTCCQGRIVSVLEGGYKIHGGIVSPFARSVASHVRALVEGGGSRELYNVADGEWESKFERQLIAEKEKRRQSKLEKLRTQDAEKRRLRHIAAAYASSNPTDAVAQPQKETTDTETDMSMDLGETIVENNHQSSVDNTGSAQHHIDAMAILNEPLMNGASPLLRHDDNPLSLSSLAGDSPAIHGESSVDEAAPSRKRRRNHIDYRELYEQMKKEGASNTSTTPITTPAEGKEDNDVLMQNAP